MAQKLIPLQGMCANLTAPRLGSLPLKGRAGEGMGKNVADPCPIPHLTSPLKGEELFKLAHMPLEGERVLSKRDFS
jgi:hypothetical protein